MASSRLIVAGETYTADDINNLRADVLDNAAGHDHDGTDGKKVAFRDLDVTTGTAGSAAPSGGTHGYDDIDDHLGGSAGVHGLNASANVLGTGAAGKMLLAGSGVFGSPTGTPSHVEATVPFSPPFDSNVVYVVVTLAAYTIADVYPWVSNIGTSSCKVNAQHNAAGGTFYWMAFGPKAA